jgi:hypothetical protein
MQASFVMKRQLMFAGLAALCITSCQSDITPPTLGTIEATLNGKTWPEVGTGKSSKTGWGFSYCWNGTTEVDFTFSRKDLFSVGIETTDAATPEYTQELGVNFAVLANSPRKYSFAATPVAPRVELCSELDAGKAIGRFYYLFYDGFDILPNTTYHVDITKPNFLEVIRVDTVRREVEGRFQVNFVRYEGRRTGRPDTIQIKCSRFVAYKP